MNKKKSVKTAKRYATILWLMIVVLFGQLLLSEWYSVAIKGATQGYFFGSERPYDKPAPYYYESAELYSSVCLIEGLVLTMVALIGLILFIRKKKKALNIFLIVQLVLMVVVILHGQIGK